MVIYVTIHYAHDRKQILGLKSSSSNDKIPVLRWERWNISTSVFIFYAHVPLVPHICVDQWTGHQTNNNNNTSRDSNSASNPNPNDWEVRWSPVFDQIQPTSKVRKLYRVLDDI